MFINCCIYYSFIIIINFRRPKLLVRMVSFFRVSSIALGSTRFSCASWGNSFVCQLMYWENIVCNSRKTYFWILLLLLQQLARLDIHRYAGSGGNGRLESELDTKWNEMGRRTAAPATVNGNSCRRCQHFESKTNSKTTGAVEKEASLLIRAHCLICAFNGYKQALPTTIAFTALPADLSEKDDLSGRRLTTGCFGVWPD